MTATNHAISGAIIVTVLSNPVIGLPIALLSHFVLDAMPHFGKHPKLHFTSMAFMKFLAIDLIAAFAVLFWLVINGHALAALGGFLAMSPDAMWFPGYVRNLRGLTLKPLGPVLTFHHKIQWGEFPSGWIIEVPFLIIGITVLARIITA